MNIGGTQTFVCCTVLIGSSGTFGEQTLWKGRGSHGGKCSGVENILESESGDGVKSLLTCSLILGMSLDMGLSFSICKLTDWGRKALWFPPLPEGGELLIPKATVAFSEWEGTED